MNRGLALLLAFACAANPASAESRLDQGKAAFEAGRYEEAVKLLKKHADEYPEDVAAYRWLAESYEKLGYTTNAVQAWTDYRTLSTAKAEIERADARIAALTGKTPAAPKGTGLTKEQIDAFSRSDGVWTEKKTKHFVVRTTNQKLTDYVAEQCEGYLSVLSNKFLGGAEYPRQVPITVHRDHSSYVAAGFPAWSGGGTIAAYESAHAVFEGKVIARIDFFQLDHKGKLNPQLAKPCVIPHELTHLVLTEHFGQTRIPLWVNEGVAQYIEEGRADEAHAIVAANEQALIPLAQLVELKGYPTIPTQIEMFYHQSASFTAWLVDTYGEEKFAKFMKLLKVGRSSKDALETVVPSASGKWLDRVHDEWVAATKESAKKQK